MVRYHTGYRRMKTARALEQARDCPTAFVAYALTDPAGQPLRQAELHDDLHAFLNATAKGLVEVPRDHGKSVQVCGRILWELGRNPALRVKLVCATAAVAAERSRFLRDQIEHNDRLHAVFPHLKPADPWAAEAFTVERPAAAIGPSVAAFGVGTGSTGARADLLVCDDIVDVRSLHSRGERQRGRDYFQNNLMNLLEPDGRFWGLCTPWHPDDVNAHLKANRSYAVFHRAVGPDFQSVWADKWTPDRLRERRAEIGEAGFTRGYRLKTTTADETYIRPEWVEFWAGESGAFDRVVLAVDPAVSTNERADASGLVAAGVTGTEVRILEAVARRVRTPDLIDLIDALDGTWKPDVILFESNAAFAGLRDVLVTQTRFGAKVVGRAAAKSKDARIAALGVAVQNGRVRLKGTAGIVDASQRELFEELTSYPCGSHDDLADATAAAVAHLLDRPQMRVWV